MMKKIAAALALAGLLFAGFLAWLGYFGGEVFVPVPATAAAAPAERGTAAILLSGDMGFRIGMGPQVATRLAAHGVPVIGVNSLVYFRTRRTPEQAGQLVAEAMRHALALPGVTRVVLIGQSFGADMLQIGLPSLPADLRAKVPMVVLVVPGDTVDYRASPSELFSWAAPDARAWPTARLLTWVPVLCVQGAEETDSLCPLMTMPNATRVALPGGHPLRHDPDRLYATIAGAMERTLPKVQAAHSVAP